MFFCNSIYPRVPQRATSFSEHLPILEGTLTLDIHTHNGNYPHLLVVIVLFLHGVGLPSHLLDAYLLGTYEAKPPTPDQVSARLFEVTKVWQQKHCNPFTNRVSSPHATPDLFFFFLSSLLDQKVSLADVGQGDAGEGRCRDHTGPINTWVLQSTFRGTQAFREMEISYRPLLPESIPNSRFRMDTAKRIRSLLPRGTWVISIKLMNAYFHIPIHQID